MKQKQFGYTIVELLAITAAVAGAVAVWCLVYAVIHFILKFW